MATRKRTSAPAPQPTSTEDTSGVFMSQYDKIVEENIAEIKKEIAEIKSALAELQSSGGGGTDSRVDELYAWYERVKRLV
jgi:hypothetical protein